MVCTSSAFGTTMASAPERTVATTSSQNHSESGALTRMSVAMSDPETSGSWSRAVPFSSAATASSRSRMTPSASDASAFATMRGLLLGVNSRDRIGATIEVSFGRTRLGPAGQRTAIGLRGEPTAPVNGSGGPQNRKS